MAFNALGAGDQAAAAKCASALAVGGSGVLSFVRHAVFHRSDAARMHWDYGIRNDFQIEVGLANLSWGTGGGCGRVGPRFKNEGPGIITLVFGLYLAFAAMLHLSEVHGSHETGGGRLAPVATMAFAGGLLFCSAAVSA